MNNQMLSENFLKIYNRLNCNNKKMKQGMRAECLFSYYSTTDIGFELIKGSTLIWELYQILRLLNCFSHTMTRRKNICKKRREQYNMRHCIDEHAYTRWCIFRPTHIRHTPLLTYAKSAILHIRTTSTMVL